MWPFHQDRSTEIEYSLSQELLDTDFKEEQIAFYDKGQEAFHVGRQQWIETGAVRNELPKKETERIKKRTSKNIDDIESSEDSEDEYPPQAANGYTAFSQPVELGVLVDMLVTEWAESP